MSTIRQDVAETTETTGVEGDFDATSAFLSRIAPGDEDDANKRAPSGTGDEDEDHEGTPEDTDNEAEGSDDNSPETEGDGDESGDAEDEQGKDKTFADEGAYVKVKVDGEDKEVSLKDLTRLYGQEASLTRKSQEVAEVRKTAEAAQQKNAATLQVLIERAKQKADPFRQIDWMAVSKDPNISAEEASALRQQAQSVLEEEAFLNHSLDAFMEEVNRTSAARKVEEAKSCVNLLTTPGTDAKPNPLHIEGWNDKVYSDVRAFGLKMGANAEYVNTLTDPVAFKVMHMAMQFAKGKQGVITTKKVNKTPGKIVKTSNSPVTTRQSAPQAERKTAIKNLRNNPNKTGAAADAFYASFGVDDD